jgi:hypothetical protein
MNGRPQPLFRLLLLALLQAWVAVDAQTVINEILFNPPGSSDTPLEYIELRGRPNFVLSNGTYLVSIEGDAGANPGTIQDIFNLSGKVIGGNGFLVLLQKNHGYSPNAAATVLVNTDSGPGWGSGSSSSVGHRGEGGQTELENGSQTFFLIQSDSPPTVDADIDADDDGAPEAAFFAAWTVLDSVGLLDNDGAGDIAYGAITFRRNAAAKGSGTIVPVSFTPGYLGRSGNTTNSVAGAWVASDNLGGTAPNWTLGDSANTVPTSLASAALNHLGRPNFGANPIPGVVLIQSGGSTTVAEGGGTDSYSLALNVAPAGNVVIEINAAGPLQISTDNGASFGSVRALTFSSTASRTVLVKAPDDNEVDTSPHVRTITHTVTSTADPTRFPLSTIGPTLAVNVLENDALLLSELKVNPPGTKDEPYEFVEIKGPPNASLTNVYFLAIEGNAEKDPGKVSLAVNLSGLRLGAKGLLVIAGEGHPYNVPPDSSVFTPLQFSAAGGALGNGSITFLLVSSPSPLSEGEDLDNGDNGVLEGLPSGTTIMDSVGWIDGDANDVVYTIAVLTQTGGTPDAATRFPGDATANSSDAWFNGDLAGTAGEALAYDDKNVSADFPFGTLLTPGAANNTAPTVSPIQPLSGVIGDPTNPTVLFAVDDAESGTTGINIIASSSNPAVVPDANLIVTSGLGGLRTLRIEPAGVGYATITLAVSDGAMTRQISFPYAASAMGRPEGQFLTGITDGSTALALDPHWMFVGDDENQVLRIYSRERSGPALGGTDCNPFLGLTDIENGVPREVDIEGSTRVGQRIYWMGSHSHAEIGEPRTNRSRIFATDVAGAGPGSTLNYVGRYEFLKEDLISWDQGNGHSKGAGFYGLSASAAPGVAPKAPDGSGFNLEGLAMAPGSTNAAYVAFRAPLVPVSARTKALIVPVLNFAALATVGGPPRSAVFGPPIELDLGCRGIRSIEGDTNGYLIVAGPAGQSMGLFPQDFRLFTWSGNPADEPQQRAADLSGMNPEGIVELPPQPWTAASTVQLISDNGTTVYYGDGTPGKQLPHPNFKKFRADWVILGGVVDRDPSIISFQVVAGTVTLSWCAIPGRSYRVLFKSDLNAPEWTPLSGDILATGNMAAKADASNAARQRYYRVVLLP